jgi:hypothetical protein
MSGLASRLVGATLPTVRLLAWILAGIVVTAQGTGAALAATPSPAPGGDPRSPGEGPGLVGDPVLAIVAVMAIALASVVLTLVYLRLTERR